MLPGLGELTILVLLIGPLAFGQLATGFGQLNHLQLITITGGTIGLGSPRDGDASGQLNL